MYGGRSIEEIKHTRRSIGFGTLEVVDVDRSRSIGVFNDRTSKVDQFGLGGDQQESMRTKTERNGSKTYLEVPVDDYVLIL